MNPIDRRTFTRSLATVGAAGVLAGCAGGASQSGGIVREQQHVVVIGGGFGGATAAKYLKMLNPQLQVTLIEENRIFYTGPFSNLVLGGARKLDSIGYHYRQLQSQYDIKVINLRAQTLFDHKVILADGSVIPFDRAIISPGVDLRTDDMPGYYAGAEFSMPHAWKGAAQIGLLRRQLNDMPNDGIVLICPPPMKNSSAPSAAYERASLIANYLAERKPQAKILILDRNSSFANQSLFTEGWELFYRDLIEWRGADSGGAIDEVDVSALRVRVGSEWVYGDVVNFIPVQQAGKIARDSGLTDDSGWCPIDQLTFESMKMRRVHVIGDACIAGNMPKTAFAANNQAKAVAAVVVSILRLRKPKPTVMANTNYSLMNPDYGFFSNEMYRVQNNQIVEVAGSRGATMGWGDLAVNQKEASYARSWYDSLVLDMFR